MIQSIKKYLPLLLLLVTCLSSFAQDNYFNYENSLRFARFLKSSGQLNFAAEEYERIRFLNPDDTIVSLELLQTYRLNNQCEKLTFEFDNYRKSGTLTKSENFAREYLRTVLSCRIHSSDYFTISSTFRKNDNAFYDLSYYWIQKDYKNVFTYCHEKSDIIKQRSPELYNLTYSFENEKRKSQLLAAMMSAILPGSGKAYSNRWGDAFISFLFVGSNVFSSYRAFRKKGVESVNGWLFGGLALSFYTANIWGSAKAAKTYNSTVRNNYQNNAEKIIYSDY